MTTNEPVTYATTHADPTLRRQVLATEPECDLEKTSTQHPMHLLHIPGSYDENHDSNWECGLNVTVDETTTRIWTHGDPEPADRPAVVCHDDVTAAWDTENGWHRQEIIHHPILKDAPKGTLPAITGGESCMDWQALTETYAPLREATADEAETLTECWPGTNILAGA